MLKVFYTAFIAIMISQTASAQVEFNEDVDDFTGKDNSHVSVLPEGDMFLLGFKCLSGNINVILGHKYLGGDSDGDISVYVKFNDEEVTGPEWYSLQSGNRITLFDKRDVDPFVSEAVRSNKVAIRIIDPLDQEVLTANFVF